jgi:hypothetical protein
MTKMYRVIKMESWTDDAKTKWSNLEDIDKFVVGSSVILTVGGAIVGLLMGKPAVFAAGAGISAVLVGVRWATKGDDDDHPNVHTHHAPAQTRTTRSPGLMPRRDVDYTYGGGELGAPIGRMVDTGPVRTFNGLPSMEDAKNFPLMHRVPDADIRTEPLDDRIRWATTGPLGPYTGQTVTGFW